MANLYNLPFEKRIRIKYLMFGMIFGFTSFAIMFSIAGIGGYTIRTYFMNIPIEPEINRFIIDQIMIHTTFLLFIPLLIWMWYSKSKPRKHQHLDETVGLKTDWDKVSKL